MIGQRVAAGAFALLVGVGCKGPVLAPATAPDDVVVHLTVESKKVAEGEPIVATLTTQAAEGFTVVASTPGAEGLTAVLVSEDRRIEGDRTLVEQRWRLRGEPGSYLLTTPPLQVRGPSGPGEAVQPSSVAVDLGVQGPSSDLQGLVGVERPDTRPWALGLVLVLALAAALWWALQHRRRPDAPPVPQASPYDEAWGAWQSAMADELLDDHARALRLSAVFRRYLQRRYGWAATALTTREIGDRLGIQSGVTAALTERAGRLLLATDLLKFARQGGGAAFFASLDEDFRTFLYATRQLEAPSGAAVVA